MKTKTILIGVFIITVLALFSFKNYSNENGSKIILISILDGRGENDGFIITYGDGTKETRPYNTKVKPLERDTWVQVQLQAATILNEFKEKGYHFVGTHRLLTETMVLEKD